MFTPHVCNQIGFYVYRLIDPRNGETFYVGKGKNNRVFDHAKGDIEDPIENDNSSKLAKIRAIQNDGHDVQHVIHRHGLDQQQAIEVEAALIDAYPGLTNLVAGQRSGSLGAMHANQIIEMYEAQDFVVLHNILMITVNRSSAENSIYEAVRYAWKLDIKKARKADFVLAVIQGIVAGVFVATEWLVATPANFPSREDRSPRVGFIGVDAPQEIQDLYLRKRTPDIFRKKGAANPIKYASPT